MTEPQTKSQIMVQAAQAAGIPVIDIKLSDVPAGAFLGVPVEKTHILKAAYMSGNGRRVTHDFPITEFQATDPSARASAISSADYYGQGRGYRRLVNWTITEAK